jgi:hypothetical protein
MESTTSLFNAIQQRHLANIATNIIDKIGTPFDANLYAAFIAVQDSYPINSSTVVWIDTKHQLADIFTKPLAASSFLSLRLALLGW